MKNELAIKYLADEDKPREKMESLGKEQLSNVELVALLLGSGSTSESAISLSKRLLVTNENNLDKLASNGIEELTKYPGIGIVKATRLIAGFELGERRTSKKPKEFTTIRSSNDAYQQVRFKIQNLQHEEFWILLLNRANTPTGAYQIGKGGVSSTVADPKIMFKLAIEKLASSMILFHNHPSGNIKPSKEDHTLTRKIKSIGEMLDVVILDHLIITSTSYYSFTDEGDL